MLKVLHGPVNVANQPWVLSRHERRLGVKSDLVVNYTTSFNYPADACLGEWARKSRRAVVRRAVFALTSPLRYQVLHYYFGRSFMCWDDFGEPTRWWFGDLRLARRLGRKVFMTLQGCDARLSDRSAAENRFTPCHEGNCQAVPLCRTTLDARRRELIDDVLPLADRVFVLNPELSRFVPGAVFLPYASVDIEAIDPVWPRLDRPPVILHAPSDEGIKGSGRIVAALEKIRQRIPVELVLVRGVPHEEAMKLYRGADLVIDQVLAGWYGGFAVEAMAMGKPVACAIRDRDLQAVPDAFRSDLPLLRIAPDTLESDLEAALARREEWPAWGRRAREFVLRWHHPARLAAAMVRAYRDRSSHFGLEDA